MPLIDTSSLRGASILVVGGGGFIGRHLVRTLSHIDARIVAVSRNPNPSYLVGRNVTWRRCDAANQDEVAATFREVRPDLIYHLASETKTQGGRDVSLIPDSIRNDLVAATNVLSEAARSGKARVVITGSLEEPEGGARDAVPSSPYAAAKWASSGYARMMSVLYDLPVTVLRLMMIYGPGQSANKVIPYTIRSLLAEQQANLGSGGRMLEWVYVEDVVEAFLRAGIVAPTDPSSIDIGTGSPVRLRDLLSMVGDLVGRPDLLAFGQRADPVLEREAVADTHDAFVKLGWRARTSLSEGLLRTIDDLRAASDIQLPRPPMASLGAPDAMTADDVGLPAVSSSLRQRRSRQSRYVAG
jgi:UDP-glucose 4-epimerase